MSASSLGVTTYLVPPITIVMGLVFLDEAPPTMAYVGGALALRRRRRRAAQAASPRPPCRSARDRAGPEAAMLRR